ncbi:hypothetical protein C8R44DRAFT_360740 [Mycena epipterygia]|nr:hypothetical protein C8R44DRAFT_360740 [Mycena epipterygia]
MHHTMASKSKINSDVSSDTFSFYSDEGRMPKRRHSDISTLGVPEWHSGEPPPAPAMPGTAPPSETPAYIIAHSAVMHAADQSVKPWLGIVLYSHALAASHMPMYHNAAKIAGEVRMIIDKPTNLSSIDVWFVLKSDNVAKFNEPPLLTMTACLWNRKQGDPRAMSSSGAHFKGEFPAGTFVFPFEFPALPPDTLVKLPNDGLHHNKARVPLPPTYSVSTHSVLSFGGFSGDIKYTIGVNVTREGLGSINDEFGMDVQYLPLCRALPRVKIPFPYLPTRKDWPFAREVVGGWTLTPFGGRGHLGRQVVEVEGILGVQEPAVYTAGQTLEFTVLLWSANPLALEALAQPGAVDVGYYKSDIYAADALKPKESSRKYRKLERLAGGRIWLADVGKPAEDAPAPECVFVNLPEMNASLKTSRGAAEGADDATLVGGFTGVGLSKGNEEPIVRLDGELRVPACSHPSFRFENMAREYVLHLVLNHPQHSHISPEGTGIVAEVPVWYVLDRHFPETTVAHTEARYADLPVKGTAIMVAGAVRRALSMGHVTTQQRPTSRPPRLAAF